MNTLSKWKIKPYIDLYKWEMHHKVEFPLCHEYTYVVMEYNRHSVHVESEYDTEYIISRKDFDEVMYEVEEK